MEDSALLQYVRDHVLVDLVDQLQTEGVVTAAVASRLKGALRKS